MPMVLSRNLTLAFSAENSIEEELKRESTADVITILVSLRPGYLHVAQINLRQSKCIMPSYINKQNKYNIYTCCQTFDLNK